MSIERFFVGCVLAVVVAWPSTVGAEAPGAEEGASVLDRLTDEWRGEGRVLGQESRATLVFDRVLAERFVRLRFRNEIGEGETGGVFEGHAYYRVDEDGGTLDGRWFDSRGLAFPVRGTVEGDALVVDWGSDETERGRTTYTLLGPGELEVVDEVVSAERGLTEFGRMRYRRAISP